MKYLPARFIIDRDGIIRYANADPDYTGRPEPSDTVRVLRIWLSLDLGRDPTRLVEGRHVLRA